VIREDETTKSYVGNGNKEEKHQAHRARIASDSYNRSLCQGIIYTTT